MEQKKIIIVQHSAITDGSFFSALIIANFLKIKGFEIHVIFGFEGSGIDLYKLNEHKTYVIFHKNWLRRSQTFLFLKDLIIEIKRFSIFLKLFKDIQPQVVYVNSIVSLSGAVAGYLCKMPVIWHIRELFSNIGGEMYCPEWAKPFVRKLIMTVAYKIITNSNAVKENIFGIYHSNIFETIPNAVAENYFESKISNRDARNFLQLSDKKTIIGVPGTLRPMKGHPFFLKSFAKLIQSQPDILAIISGRSEDGYAQYLRNLVEELGLSNNVFFVGQVFDMRYFYRACDCICIPSVTEPFGRVVIEAFACEVPVIATNVGGIPEIITNGETGLLVEYGDEEEMALAIQQILQDSELRYILTRNARLKAIDEFSIAIHGERILGVVREVTEGTNCH